LKVELEVKVEPAMC